MYSFTTGRISTPCYLYVVQLTPSGAFQWPITPSITFTFTLTHPVDFPVGGNRTARRKPTIFG